MRFAPLLTIALAATLVGAGTVAAVSPAEAQSQKRTKITITKRSYLDPGNVVKPGTQSYLNYALPPNYFYPTYVGDAAGPGPITGLRWPLPGPFDLPGTPF